jgi:anti-sigma B factor antagonist
MKLKMKETRGAVVIEVRGKLIGGPEISDRFHELIDSLVAQDAKSVVFDLGHTSWANSQGIGLLIGAHTRLQRSGGRLVLARVVDRIQDILSVTRLLLIFKTFATVEDALEYIEDTPVDTRTVAGREKSAWVGNAARLGQGHGAA